jgi:hypothetical protein
MLRQGMDTQIHHKLRIIQDDPGDPFFGAGEIMGAFAQPQQGIAHRRSPLFLFPVVPFLCKFVLLELYPFLLVFATQLLTSGSKTVRGYPPVHLL